MNDCGIEWFAGELAHTSHELRTPLNGIIGIAQGVMSRSQKLEPAKRQRNLGMVVASGKRLTSLVNDLLDFSRMRHANLKLQPKSTDLRTLTDVILGPAPGVADHGHHR